jgi:MFS family permease
VTQIPPLPPTSFGQTLQSFWLALTRSGLIPELIPDATRRQRANGFIEVAQATSRLAAPATAGIVVATVGAASALFVNGATYLLSGVILTTLPCSASQLTVEPWQEAIVRGWREFRSREWLWLTITWFALLQVVAQGPLLVLGAVTAKQHLMGATGWGFVLAALGVGAVAGAGLTVVVRLERPLRPAILGYLLYAPLLGALAIGASFPSVIATGLAAGLGGGFFSATWFTVFQRNVPHGSLARISSLDWAASLSGLPIGMLLAPQIGAAIGLRATFLAAAIAVVLLTLLLAARRSVALVPATKLSWRSPGKAESAAEPAARHSLSPQWLPLGRAAPA